MTEKNYLKIVKASAWYDLVVTAGFATPWTFTFLYGMMQSWQTSLGLPGVVPDLTVTDILFANLLGSIVVIWAVLRLRQTSVSFGRYDACGRFMFTTWQLYAVLTGGGVILLAFTFFEALFGILQSIPIKKQ